MVICLGDTEMHVDLRFTIRYTQKYRSAKQFEINVVSPAPAEPMLSPVGRMNIGSRTIFIRQPLIVPILA